MANTSTSNEMRLNHELIFNLASSYAHKTFGPRLGQLQMKIGTSHKSVVVCTPCFTTSTSRGVVPHLSGDHVQLTKAIRWVNLPFETFLERDPPIPIIITTPSPLRDLVGFQEDQTIITMSLRDPFDTRELPPNGNKFANAYCIRGVRKMTPDTWRTYTAKCKPDLVVALSDIPFTQPPYSQKRLTKSIDRSVAWLGSFLQSSSARTVASNVDSEKLSEKLEESNVEEEFYKPTILVQMVGDISASARRYFSAALLETLSGKEAEQVKPLKTLDEGLFGYVFDLEPLRKSILVEQQQQQEIENSTIKDDNSTSQNQVRDEIAREIIKPVTHPHSSLITSHYVPLLQTSLSPLPANKLRIVNSAGGPHEVLTLIQKIGIDVFDAHWAQKAADWGVALDFEFPVDQCEREQKTESDEEIGRMTRKREDEKYDLGHNLYDGIYAEDFGCLSALFLPGCEGSFMSSISSITSSSSNKKRICHCGACSPISPSIQLSHSSIDIVPNPLESSSASTKYENPYKRAYLHHLLHTHEMSAHALLVMHNLTVLDMFLEGVRKVLSISLSDSSSNFSSPSDKLDFHPNEQSSFSPESEIPIDEENLFAKEVKKFYERYDAEGRIFEEAKMDWIAVDIARGKGRLAREKAKLAETNLETKVEVDI